MKLNGKTINKPNEVVVVLPRGDDNLVFKAQAVLSYKEFDQLVPLPKPPTIMRPGGEKSVDLEDEKYNKLIEQYAEKKTTWLFIKSLEATPGLEWETLNPKDPSTWKNFDKEFENSGLCEAEIRLISNAVMEANALNSDKIEKAKQSFLASAGGQQ